MYNIALIIISVLLSVSILMQQRNAGGGGIFGGSGGGSGNAFQTRRGFDKTLFISSIILAVLFIGLAFVRLLIA